MRCLNHLVDAALKRFFFRLGQVVGDHPGYFIVVPLLLTALCASGFQQLNYEFDPEYLFSPATGHAKAERAVLDQHFPTNYSAFKSSRLVRPGKFSRLIITAADGGSMLRTALWNQLLYVDQIVYNVSVEHRGESLRYDSLCAKWVGFCYDNEILRISDQIPSMEVGEINMTYPVYFDPNTFEAYPLPAFFGGVNLSAVHTITGVKAISLAYFLDVTEEWQKTVGDAWERSLLNDIDTLAEVYAPDLKVAIFVSNTPAWEMERSRLSVTTTLCFNVGLMVVFCFLSTAMSDSVRSKPLLGFLGLMSATLATLAAFGFCCYIGIEFISLNMAAPFLLLGIGVDDTFVMLSSWRRSSLQLPVAERMGRTYQDAAVSITVTSLTNFLSFLTGVSTVFPSIRIFCIYSGVSVAFIYVWHCTLFGACLAIAGRAESQNRHGLFCVKVQPKSLSQHRNFLYRWFVSGGINPRDPHNPRDNRDHAMMVFFRDRLGSLLCQAWVKAIVLVVYIVYLVFACWGVTRIKEGLQKRNTANYDSYAVTYYDTEDKYFKEYAFTISVVFHGPNINFASPAVQQKVELITQSLENTTYIDAKVTQSWLRDFLDYVRRSKQYGDVDLAVSSEADFAHTLRTVYLTDASSPLNLDVEFSSDSSRVTAARILIQGRNVLDSYMEQQMVSELREVCDRYSTPEMSVIVFQPFFIYIDQYLEILPQSMMTIFITAVIMVLIALIFIPSLICAIWVSLSIVSIEIGVMGYMAWWNVSLDGVALINLIMCIGFSVDFSAHISYHYISDSEGVKSPEERIKASLYGLGLPIIQGAGSTIFGVLGLAFAPSYLFVTFFKMIFLVIVLGLMHGLVLLPVLLSLLGPGSCSWSAADKSLSTSRSRSSSGVSTPTTVTVPGSTNPAKHMSSKTRPHAAIAYHKQMLNKEACSFTVNMGFVADNEAAKPDHCHHHRHHRRGARTSAQAHSSPGSNSDRNSDWTGDTGIMTRELQIRHMMGQPSIQAMPPSQLVSSRWNRNNTEWDKIERHENKNNAKITESQKNAVSAKLGVGPSSNAAYHVPRDAVQKQRVGRSKSSSANTQAGRLPAASTSASASSAHKAAAANPRGQAPAAGGKEPLRKYNSVPYKVFLDDLGYSSEELLPSPDQTKRPGPPL